MKQNATLKRLESGMRNMCVGLVCCVLAGACGGPGADPEAELRLWVERAQAAAEARERRDLVDMISSAYADSRGNKIDDIENMLRAYFFRQHAVKLVTSIEEIRLYGDSAAEIDLVVGMAGKNDGAFGFSADAYRFQFELEKKGGEWLLLAARWAEFGEELH
jgi:hypothetical protein